MPDERESAATIGMTGEPIARGLLLLGTGQAFFIVCGYIFHIYLARNLGPSDYGLFGFVFAVLVWLEIFTYGMRDAAIQYINELPRSFSSLYRSFFRVQVCICMGFFLLANLAFLPLVLMETRYDALFVIAFLDLPLMGLYQLYLGYLNGFRLFSRQAAALIVYAVTKAFFIILFVWVGWGVAGALFGNIFSSLFAYATAYILFWPRRRGELAALEDTAGDAPHTEGKVSTKSIVASSLLFIIIPLFYNLMMSMDLWVVNLAIGGEMVGFYVAAGTIAKAVFFLFAAFYMTLFPVTVASLRWRDEDKSARLFSLSFALFLFIALPASLLLAVNAREITLLIYGADYGPASLTMSVLSVAYFFLTLNVFFVYILYAGGRRRAAARILLGVPTLSLPLIYLLNRWMGIEGAALGTAIACLCGAILSYLDIHGNLHLAWKAWDVARAVALALLVFMPLALIPKNLANFIPLSCLFAAIYFFALQRTGFLPWSSLKHLLEVLTGNVPRP